MTDMNFGTLVGRIDEGESFRVGTSFVLVSPISKRLLSPSMTRDTTTTSESSKS